MSHGGVYLAPFGIAEPVHGVVAVGQTAEKIPVNNKSGRRAVIFQNLGTARVWIGGQNVATSGANRGIVLATQFSSVVFEASDLVQFYAVAEGVVDNDVSFLEIL